jgi:hypothetical protein
LGEAGAPTRRFADWLKIGVALTLPLAILLVVLLAVYLLATHPGGAAGVR